MLTLTALNAKDKNAFVATLANVFEHSPWIALAAFDGRPFASVDALHGAMVDVMRKAGHDRQRALILAHPELGAAKIATDFSKREQAGAGLNTAQAEERIRLRDLNKKYRERLGFPFIIAVKGRSPPEIMKAIERRLTNSSEIEFETALDQIAQIARFRLDAMVTAS